MADPTDFHGQPGIRNQLPPVYALLTKRSFVHGLPLDILVAREALASRHGWSFRGRRNLIWWLFYRDVTITLLTSPSEK